MLETRFCKVAARRKHEPAGSAGDLVGTAWDAIENLHLLYKIFSQGRGSQVSRARLTETCPSSVPPPYSMGDKKSLSMIGRKTDAWTDAGVPTQRRNPNEPLNP